MALRVLLADESSTIKKAVQMALSDLGVDVKSVPSGLDVLTVANSFSPHIVLADVLLSKKNGYDVCEELKSDSRLKSVPVVLMWSSFLHLDQDQFKRVKADASLEKPFDSESLRDLIEKHVPQYSRSPLHGLLNHPDLPDFEESETFVRQKNQYESAKSTNSDGSDTTGSGIKNRPGPAKKSTPIVSELNAASIDQSLDEIEEFSEVSLHSKINKKVEDEWKPHTPQKPDDYIVRTESHGDFEEVTVLTNVPTEESAPELQKRIEEQVRNYVKGSPVAQTKSAAAFTKPTSELEEQLMREEIRLMAEKICWQILPEITERIVREEIGKLLNGLEKV